MHVNRTKGTNWLDRTELPRLRFDDWSKRREIERARGEAEAREARETETVGRRATGEKERNRDRLPGGRRASERGPHSVRITDAYRSVA